MAEGSSSSRTSTRRWALLIGLGLVALIVASFLVETLLPLHRSGRTTELLLNLIGFPIVLVGTAVFVHGGFVVVRNTFSAWALPELAENTAAVRKKSAGHREAAARNRSLLFRAWKPGLIRMLIGFLIIAIGSVVINGLKIFGEDQLM